MSDNSNPFIFYPRPEAHATNWDDLLPPLKEAVRDLLVRIAGATKKVERELKDEKKDDASQITPNCFLVYGKRGTGKTTVLLSMKEAVCNPKDFFRDKATEENSAENGFDLKADAQRCAKQITNVIWLDVLDLQPLPPHANLLTTMLTSVRNALYSSSCENTSAEVTSILEEGADSPRHKLDRLIKDATLMWEDIVEPDTRNKANRQVAAADIYAQFQKRFRDAMEALSREIGRHRGGPDKYHIILPVDNIDRSTDHLYRIVKLAQMVNCPHLWLVMAGDREDVDTFLERAYWKELISVGEGAGGVGREGPCGEDEALVMARRQAAAASHRLLPPSHRTEVKPVNPIDTLSFRPLSLHSQSADPNNQHSTDDSSSIRDLFKKIHIYVQEGSIIEFTELFDARNSIKTKTEKAPASKEDPTKEEARYLTYAARLGLRLPARGVLDLWQLAHRVVNDPKIERKRRAAKLARTMLRNFIAESAMSSKAGRCLQERIIRRTATDRTILDFYEPNPTLNVSRLYSPDFELRVNLAQGLEGRNTRKTNVRSWLSICRPYAAVLSLKKRSQHPIRGDADCNDSDCNSALLPDLVAAWLIILYDILIWAPKMAVIAPPRLETAPLIKTSYEVVQVDGQRLIRNERASLWWPAPRWEISLAHDVFQQLWEQFLDSLETLSVLGLTSDFLVRLLAMGWISCALDTFRTPLRVPDPEELADAKSSRDVEKSDVNIRSRNSERKWIMATVIEKLRQSEKWTNKDMEDTEKNTLEAAAGLYSEILKYSGEVLQIGSKSDPRDRPQFFSPHNGLISMRNWLEQELPLLLSNFYVPVTTTGGEAHSRIKIDFIKDTELAKSWSNNSMFILAKLEKELSDVFSVTPENPELPAYFKDLHQYWADIGSGTT